MKKIVFPVFLLGASLTLASCGTTGSSSVLGALANSSANGNSSTGKAESGSGSLLGGLLSGLLSGSTELSKDNLVGTWKYTKPDCVFESENLLMKAGGAVAANKIEGELSEQLAKVGIKSGSCTFKFNSDGTYVATLGSRTINGNYTLDTKNKTLKLTYLAGIGSVTPRIAKTGNNVSLLFESDKLLKLVSAVSALSNSNAATALGKLASSYDGMYIGIQMSK